MRNFVLNNFPFLENDFDAITDYELFCKMVEYMRNAVNQLSAYDKKFIEFNQRLTEIENYIATLDIQDEVDKKLDEMYENGQLATLITQFLSLSALYIFNDIDEMIAGTNFVDGSIAKTLHFANDDNGGAFYRIRTVTNEDVIDNITLFAITELPTLVAELIPQYEMNTSQFGCVSEEDNTANFTKIIGYINDDIIKKLTISDGIYILSSKLTIEDINGLIITGNGTISNEVHDNNCIEIDSCNNLIIENINLYSTYQYSNPDTSEKRGIIHLYDVDNFEIRNVKMNHINSGFNFSNCSNGKIYNNTANDCKRWPYMFGEYGESHTFYHNDNLEIFNNISNNCIDGIKLTGYITNILIHDNISTNNQRDGLDFAGFSCDKINIYNNLFASNAAAGIEYKHLIRTTYTPDPLETLYFKNISIYNNKIMNNQTSGIELHGYYNDDDENYNIIIKNNDVIYDLIETNTNVYGISVGSNTAEKENAIIIANNNIKGNYRIGLQIRNSNHVLIENNNIEKTQRGGLRINYNTDDYSTYGITFNDLIIKNNTIVKSTNAGCIMGDNTSNVTNCIIINNTFDFERTSAYPITSIDETGIKILTNFAKTPESTTPTGRSFKNVVIYSSDTATTNCIGWITTTSSASATFKKYIDLS